MTTIIDRHRADIEALCRTYRVKRLDVFGSAAREDFDPARERRGLPRRVRAGS